MQRLVSRLLIMTLVAAGLLVGPASASHADVDPVADGSRFLGTCMQSARSLSVLFLFDRSGSLAQTDPQGVRYEGLQVALERLTQLSRPDGNVMPVEVAVSSFDDDYQSAATVVGWTGLNDEPENAERVIAQIVKEARDRTGPRGATNFEDALNGAFSDFEDRLGDRNCRVAFWFTDGEFWVGNADVSSRAAAMCAPGGIVDRIRENRIVLAGLQLGNESQYLGQMALGDWNSAECGTRPLPEGWAPGMYVQADDAASLRRLFGPISGFVQGCTPVGDSPLMEPGINRMQVTIEGDGIVDAVRFDTPAGLSFTAETQGTTESSGYTVQSVRDHEHVLMDIRFPTGSPAGEWRVTPSGAGVVPGGIAFCVFTDLRLEKTSGLPTMRGTDSLVTLQVVDRDGVPAALTPYRVNAGADSVQAFGHSGESRPVGVVEIDAESGLVTIPVAAHPTDARLDMNVRLGLMTESGRNLTPLSINFGQAMGLASNFPLVEPIDVLDLGTAVKTAPAVETLQLVGSPDGATQVCIDQPSIVHAPPGTTNSVITSSVDWRCVDLGASETKEVTISVTPSQAAVGDGEAVLPMRLVSADTPSAASETAEFDLPVLWRFSDPTNLVASLAVALIIGLLSALVPLAAISLANWRAARYQVKGLRATDVDVIVGPGGLRRAERSPDMHDGLVDARQVSAIPGLGATARRRFTVHGLAFRSRAPKVPTHAPRFWVEPEAGWRVTSSTAAPGDPDDGSWVSASPALGMVVILACRAADLSGDDKEISGRLVLLTKGMLASEEFDRLVQASIDADAFRRRVRDAAATSPGIESTAGTGDQAQVNPFD